MHSFYKVISKRKMSTLIVNHPLPVVRRSGNYKPCIWDSDFVKTLSTDYKGERFNGRVNELKGNVIEMLNNVVKPLDQLELIDDLQRLGLGYHFEQEIKSTLTKIYEDQSYETLERKDLHAVALKFRLLRQHGYNISQDVFKYFMENGSFKGSLCEDAKGVLSLYEAYYFSSEGESIMEAAWSFTSKTLREICLHSGGLYSAQKRYASLKKNAMQVQFCSSAFTLLDLLIFSPCI